MLATLPGRTQGLGLITEPMLRDLQLDRVTYATINLWATLLGAAICLPIGRVFDRVGLRGTTFALTLLLAAVVWAMSRLGGRRVVLFAAGAGHARARAERAVGRQHHRRRQVVRPRRRRGDGRLLGAAERVLRAAFVAVGTSVRVDGLAHRVGAGGDRPGRARRAGDPVAARAAAARGRRRTTGGPATAPRSAAALRTPAFWVFARRDLAVRPGLVGPRPVQRSRARRARLRSGRPTSRFWPRRRSSPWSASSAAAG